MSLILHFPMVTSIVRSRVEQSFWTSSFYSWQIWSPCSCNDIMYFFRNPDQHWIRSASHEQSSTIKVFYSISNYLHFQRVYSLIICCHNKNSSKLQVSMHHPRNLEIQKYAYWQSDNRTKKQKSVNRAAADNVWQLKIRVFLQQLELWGMKLTLMLIKLWAYKSFL